MAERFCIAPERMEKNMSLISDSFVPCVIMDKTTTDNGYGYPTTVWKEGAPVECSIVLDGTVEQILAQQLNWTGSYTVTTHKGVIFYPDDVFKRLSDGKTFRVKSSGAEDATPEISSLNLRKVKAEEVTL